MWPAVNGLSVYVRNTELGHARVCLRRACGLVYIDAMSEWSMSLCCHDCPNEARCLRLRRCELGERWKASMTEAEAIRQRETVKKLNAERVAPHSEGSSPGERVRIIAVDSRSGRQVVHLHPDVIQPPLIELRYAGPGFGWRDRDGHEWMQASRSGDEKPRWMHSLHCLCNGLPRI